MELFVIIFRGTLGKMGPFKNNNNNNNKKKKKEKKEKKEKKKKEGERERERGKPLLCFFSFHISRLSTATTNAALVGW